MNISNFRKNIINFFINLFTVLISTWTVVLSGILLRGGVQGFLYGEGVDFAFIIYSFFVIFLIPSLYIYNLIYPQLLQSNKVLFIVSLLVQSLFYLGIERIIDYKIDRFLPDSLGYLNLLFVYFFFTSLVLVPLWLFEKIRQKIDNRATQKQDSLK